MNRLIYILFFLPFSFYGQDSLSLSQAIKIGLQKNYDILLTGKNIEINKLFNSCWEWSGDHRGVRTALQKFDSNEIYGEKNKNLII